MVSAPEHGPRPPTIHVIVTGAPAAGKTESLRTIEGNGMVKVVEGAGLYLARRFMEGPGIRPIVVWVVQPEDLERAKAHWQPIMTICIVRGASRPLDPEPQVETVVFNDATVLQLQLCVRNLISDRVAQHLRGY